MRPFDADRDGQVWGEGAAVILLERRDHAEARGATILARLLAAASACDCRSLVHGPCCGPTGGHGDGLRQAMRVALKRANIEAARLGHLNAHGLSTRNDDRIEAAAIHDVASDVPVTAPKSYFGNLGAAGGVMEMAVSVLAFGTGIVPPSLNYRRPDPECPVRVIHGEPLATSNATALVLNRTSAGQAAVLVVAGP
jgi:3-oxoacyl-[acyl-carrier-protein] synthase II